MTRTATLIAEGGQVVTLVQASRAAVPGGGGPTSAELRRPPHPLPFLLAGPILRTASKELVVIWLATSAPASAVGKLLMPPEDLSGRPLSWTTLARHAGSTMQVGRRLFIHRVAIAAPRDNPFPLGRILAYDLDFQVAADHAFDRQGGLLQAQDIAYAPSSLPTFVIDQRADTTRRVVLWHASCRKLHGGQSSEGEHADAMFKADTRLRERARDPATRPAALLLTGDQIYADDVPPELNERLGLALLSQTLLGWLDKLPEPDHRAACEIPDRYRVVADAGFTVNEEAGRHHLIDFGEFCAMYLLAWSPALWAWFAFAERVDRAFGDRHRRSAAATRRVLANVAAYMMWDDHEISDDWPLDAPMHDAVMNSEMGRWIVANGMLAAWLFQLKDNPDSGATAGMAGGLGTLLAAGSAAPPSGVRWSERQLTSYRAAQEAYARSVTGTRGFGFVTPNVPPIVVLDTRTERDLHRDAAPSLIDASGLRALGARCAALGRPGRVPPEGEPLLVVSPTNVIGDPLIEYGQEVSYARSQNRAEHDPEAWSLQPGAFEALFAALARAGRRWVVFFSGDVHYGYAARGEYVDRSGSLVFRFAQLTSSALLNVPAGGTRSAAEGLRGWRNVTNAARRIAGLGDARSTYRLPSGAELRFRFLPVAGDGSGTFLHPNFGEVVLEWNQRDVTKLEQQLLNTTTSGPVARVVG